MSQYCPAMNRAGRDNKKNQKRELFISQMETFSNIDLQKIFSFRLTTGMIELPTYT